MDRLVAQCFVRRSRGGIAAFLAICAVSVWTFHAHALTTWSAPEGRSVVIWANDDNDDDSASSTGGDTETDGEDSTGFGSFPDADSDDDVDFGQLPALSEGDEPSEDDEATRLLERLDDIEQEAMFYLAQARQLRDAVRREGPTRENMLAFNQAFSNLEQLDILADRATERLAELQNAGTITDDNANTDDDDSDDEDADRDDRVANDNALPPGADANVAPAEDEHDTRAPLVPRRIAPSAPGADDADNADAVDDPAALSTDALIERIEHRRNDAIGFSRLADALENDNTEGAEARARQLRMQAGDALRERNALHRELSDRISRMREEVADRADGAELPPETDGTVATEEDHESVAALGSSTQAEGARASDADADADASDADTQERTDESADSDLDTERGDIAR